MVTYRVHQRQLSEQLQVEFVYENSPVFAGTDEFSLLIRFRYTGELSNLHLNTQLKDPFVSTNTNGKNLADSERNEGTQNEFNKDNDSTQNSNDSKNGSWFGSRFSSQLSNATRSLFLHNLNSVSEENEDEDENSKLNKSSKNKRLTLFLGYGQILGHYLINDTILDYSIFKDLEKSTIIEGKYAGVSGLDAKPDSDDGTGMLAGLTTKYNSEINSSVDAQMVDHMKFIPFYSTNQNILFSELVFNPDQWTPATKPSQSVKSFYMNCKLPKDLPPTYSTEAVQINYNFILGYQIMDGNSIMNKTVFVPLKIQPFIDNYGRQPIYNLGKAKLNTFMEDLVVEDVSSHHSLIRNDSSAQNGQLLPNGEIVYNQPSRRISFWNLKRKLAKNNYMHSRNSSLSTLGSFSEKRRGISVGTMSNMDDINENVSEFLDILDYLDKTDVNNIIKVQEQFEKKMNETKIFKFNVRENLMQILSDYKYVQRQQLVKNDDTLEYDYLLPKEQQIKYLIKQDHGLISTLFLNKGIFKVGDLINLNLSFEDSRYETKGVEIQLLKHQVFYRDEYLKKGNYDEVSARLDKNTLETILFEKVMSTFGTTTINTNILIPIETEPQFKTNFFHCKYYIQVRFIIINAIEKKKTTDITGNNVENEANEESLEKKVLFDMKNIFIDTTGSMLFRARDHLSNANEFYIRIPVVMLPTYEQDFGIVTNKV